MTTRIRYFLWFLILLVNIQSNEREQSDQKPWLIETESQKEGREYPLTEKGFFLLWTLCAIFLYLLVPGALVAGKFLSSIFVDARKIRIISCNFKNCRWSLWKLWFHWDFRHQKHHSVSDINSLFVCLWRDACVGVKYHIDDHQKLSCIDSTLMRISFQWTRQTWTLAEAILKTSCSVL
jgi:hypothetical protein